MVTEEGCVDRLADCDVLLGDNYLDFRMFPLGLVSMSTEEYAGGGRIQQHPFLRGK